MTVLTSTTRLTILALVEALRDRDPSVRLDAAAALRSINTKVPGIVPTRVGVPGKPQRGAENAGDALA